MNLLLRKHCCLGLLLAAGAAFFSGCAHDRAVEREETRREAFDLLTEGQQLKEQGDYLLARDVLLEAAEASPRPVVYYEIGDTYYRLGEYDRAISYYDKALRMTPGYEEAEAARDLAVVKAEGPVAESAEPEENEIGRAHV